jgi:hypothetical protein
MRHVPLKFVQRAIPHGGPRSTNASLSLTSMIDFLVVTVVFLLMTFSTASACPPAKGVNVPIAAHVLDAIDAPIVTVWRGHVMVDGSPAGSTELIESHGHVRRLDDVFHLLCAKRELWGRTHPQRDFPGVAVLELDQDVPALVVKSVFQTAAIAGYPNVSFMVQAATR